MFEFYWPWLAVLLPLPLLAWFILPRNSNPSNSPTLRFPALGRLEETFKDTPLLFRGAGKWVQIILWCTWICLVLAVMRPQHVEEYISVIVRGHDLMLVVDTSGSMSSPDMGTAAKEVTRLDATKEVVGEFVEKRYDDRIGLVIFDQEPFTISPLTTDTMVVKSLLDNIAIEMTGGGTAIGDGLALAVRSLCDRPESSRVIILLTDGENNSGKILPLDAAELAKHFGIRVYTIGIGSNADYGVDEELLIKIAYSTEGKYYRATDKESLEQIYDEINAIEKSESEEKINLIRTPLYRYPLSIAMILLFLLCSSPYIRRLKYDLQ